MLWKSGPAATELEQRALDWLRRMMGLEAPWFGVINDTASIGTLLALAAAREAKPELDIRQRGMAGRSDLPTLRIYASEHAHSSVDKAVMALGFGHENLVSIAGNERFEMRADLLQRAIADDRAHGMLLSRLSLRWNDRHTSVDTVQRSRPFVHVNRYVARRRFLRGVAAIVPECRDTIAGVDLAIRLSSILTNGFHAGRHLGDVHTEPGRSQACLRPCPEYLTTAEQDSAVNLMEYGVQLGAASVHSSSGW